MSVTAQEVFTETVRSLPPTERLRLAALILQDLAQTDMAVVDASSLWSDQDQHDITTFSLQHATALYPEEDELV